jgi:hypothetical protein
MTIIHVVRNVATGEVNEYSSVDEAQEKVSVLVGRGIPIVTSTYERDESAVNGIVLTRHQLQAWAGRSLTAWDIERLDECIPNSSIPEAIETIVSSWPDDEL